MQGIQTGPNKGLHHEDGPQAKHHRRDSRQQLHHDSEHLPHPQRDQVFGDEDGRTHTEGHRDHQGKNRRDDRAVDGCESSVGIAGWIPVGNHQKAEAETGHRLTRSRQHGEQDAEQHQAHKRSQNDGELAEALIHQLFLRGSPPQLK